MRVRLLTVVTARSGRQAVAVVAGVGMLFVEIYENIAKRTVVGIVFTAVVEAAGVSTSMRPLCFPMEIAMLIVISGMLSGIAAVSIGTLRHGAARWNGERQKGSGDQYFSSHGDLHKRTQTGRFVGDKSTTHLNLV